MRFGQICQAPLGMLRKIASGATMTILVAGLAGCNAVPNNGPLAGEIEGAAAGVEASGEANKVVFEVVHIDQKVADTVSEYYRFGFSRVFGSKAGQEVPVIGVGDALTVVVFEAGPDGLFSSSDKRATSVPVVVEPNGEVQIPYAGSIRFAGLTIAQARRAVVDALESKAVEPDVSIVMEGNESRTVSVLGAVGKPSIVPLGMSPRKITDVLAGVGGNRESAEDMTVTLTRGGRSSTMALSTILEYSSENIYVRPGDQLYFDYDPRTFTALGSSYKSGQLEFKSDTLSIVEAAARVGGANVSLANPTGYFLFRYETGDVYINLVGKPRFDELISKGMRANRDGLYPIVYRLDMLKPESYLVAQNFQLRNKDVLYLSRHPATDFAKFLDIVYGAGRAGYYVKLSTQ